MIFNPKHQVLNCLFAELGCTIGKLSDSSKYNDRFITIADRVIELNEGGKVDKKVLKADVELMLGMLEKEGYWLGNLDVLVNPLIVYRRWFSMKAYWELPEDIGKACIISTLVACISIFFTIVVGISWVNWQLDSNAAIMDIRRGVFFTGILCGIISFSGAIGTHINILANRKSYFNSRSLNVQT